MKQSCVPVNISYILSRGLLLFKVDDLCINWLNAKLKEKMVLGRKESKQKKKTFHLPNDSKLKKEKDIHNSFIIDGLINYLRKKK